MKKIIVLSLLIFCASIFNLCLAQYVRPGDNTPPPPPVSGTQSTTNTPPSGPADNLSVGGGFGLQFGDITFIELEPLLNYHFSQSFMIGVGPIYQYENVDAQVFGYPYTASLYGARISGIFFLPEEFSRVFLMAEYDVINVPEPNSFNYTIGRGYIGLPMAGIGYKEPVSDKVFFYIYGLWNFNNTTYNPYSNPVINVGFDIGLWH